ncbi:two-component sensor histidine kinase [Palleronia sediminis]|uniref:histidine kinase n=1 Tax=Palleronia sediminis TaxID=2547833 RepID=A0A4R6AJD6_9RHOB|nr:ATP-binding protein [Palleronia sediminis]TDL83627.1 two-component sensor histidine kinase [Palleronia sediminis]
MAAPGPAALLGALPWPALLIGATRRIEAANRDAHSLLGRQMTGRHYGVALRQPALLDAIETVEAGAPAATARYLGRGAGVETTWIAHVARAGGGVLVTFEDRTASDAAGRVRRDFVANVSHELKTPLTAIAGFVETLRGPARDDPEARERFLGIMETETRRMARLVDDLLSLSRLEEGEADMPAGVTDLAEVIRAVLRMMEDGAAAAEVDLGLDLPDGPQPVTGDADQLRQVFANLVENAVKYGARSVTVSLAAEDRAAPLGGPGYRVEVCDDGRGIEARHLPRLTERFYRVDSHRARDVGGTGLGLAIVKHIVSRHRGRLVFASTPGEGTRVTVLLPAKRAEGGSGVDLS